MHAHRKMGASPILVNLILALVTTCFVGVYASYTEDDLGVGRRTFTDRGGKEHHILVQEPKAIGSGTPVLIYLHGAKADERQGMDPEWACGTMVRLRALMERWQWIYVTPRDYDLGLLRSYLRKAYGKRPIYVIGGSRGGEAALRDARIHSAEYAGLIVISPAFKFTDMGTRDPYYPMPLWIDSAEGDKRIHSQCRLFARELKRRGRTFHFHQYPGGDHGSAIEAINWEKALSFVTTGKECARFKARDFKDWEVIFKRFKRAGEGEPTSLENRILAEFPKVCRDKVMSWSAEEVDAGRKGYFLTGLNRLLALPKEHPLWKEIQLAANSGGNEQQDTMVTRRLILKEIISQNGAH